MYESFFHFEERPFGLLPDPAFIYWSQPHSHAYTMLEYGVLSNAGFTVITGGIGCGKTTLVRYLLSQLLGHVTVGLLSNTQIVEGEFLRWVMMSLGQPFDQPTLMGVFDDFQNFLISQYNNRRRTLLIVDEAQNLSATTLEELRMLSNINADKDQLLQIILVGQPGLRDTLAKSELAQFVQRISSEYHLSPLDAADVENYIRHRLQHAGGDPDIFTNQAIRMVVAASKGIPRVINVLCDTALVYAYSASSPQVTGDIMQSVLNDRRGNAISSRAS